jgi:hypothetical protein
MGGLPQFQVSLQKSQVLEIHKHWKAFQVVLQQGVSQDESFSKDLL